VISWDLIGPLPECNGFNAILVIVDRFTKRMIAEAMHTMISSEGSAKVMRDRVFRDHGLPRNIISDRGLQFVSKFMMELYRMFGINGNPSTAYQSQTDRQMEQVNQEIEQYLRIFINN
jgi:hypothetical protein